MPTPLTNHTEICTDDPTWSPDEAHLAAAAFLARYSGRTLEAYRHDLRYYFQWATDQHLAVLDASRAHIEIYRSTMEQRGLAASTIDRRLSTVCGYYRFAHIDQVAKSEERNRELETDLDDADDEFRDLQSDHRELQDNFNAVDGLYADALDLQFAAEDERDAAVDAAAACDAFVVSARAVVSESPREG